MTIPESIRAGDTLNLDWEHGDYDPATWSAELVLLNENSSYSATGSDNGDGSFNFGETAANTANWVPGSYKYFIRVTDAPTKVTVEEGYITIKPDITGPVDDRSHIKRTLDILEAAIEGQATASQLSYSIAGRQVVKYTPDQLVALHQRYTALYEKEKGEQDPTSKRKTKIKARFR